MNLTKNVTLESLCVTKSNIPNIPTELAKEKLMYLATYIVQPIIDKFGPLDITSGYRSDAVNTAIGGSKTSQHPKGEAVDFSPRSASIDEVFKWCRDNLKYGQVINEMKGKSRWIHISLPRIGGINQQPLNFVDGVYSKA